MHHVCKQITLRGGLMWPKKWSRIYDHKMCAHRNCNINAIDRQSHYVRYNSYVVEHVSKLLVKCMNVGYYSISSVSVLH